MMSMNHKLEKTKKLIENKSIRITLPGQVVISHGCISISLPIQLSVGIFRVLSLDDKH